MQKLSIKSDETKVISRDAPKNKEPATFMFLVDIICIAQVSIHLIS